MNTTFARLPLMKPQPLRVRHHTGTEIHLRNSASGAQELISRIHHIRPLAKYVVYLSASLPINSSRLSMPKSNESNSNLSARQLNLLTVPSHLREPYLRSATPATEATRAAEYYMQVEKARRSDKNHYDYLISNGVPGCAKFLLTRLLMN